MTMLGGLTSMFTQPAFQAVATGLLTGVVVGSTMIASGILPLEPQREDPKFVALLACPGVGPELARVPAGQQLLITARSEDGAWLEVYLGEPGVDFAWAPAPALRAASTLDALPVSQCDTSQTFLPTLGPPDPTDAPPTGVPATVVPTPGPTLATGTTATPTPPPTPTPKITASPKPKPTKTATPTPTPVPPTPTPFIDQTAPSLTGLTPDREACEVFGEQKYCIYRPSASCSTATTVTISVTATDSGSGVKAVTLFYRPLGGSVTSVNLTLGGSNVWNGVIAALDSWNDGEVEYWVTAEDNAFNFTNPTYPAANKELYVGMCFA